MNEEIMAGLKNALERGDSLENAVASFINSGYNPEEVRAAAEILSTGVSQIVYNAESTENRPQTAQLQGQATPKTAEKSVEANPSEITPAVNQVKGGATQLPKPVAGKKKNKVILLLIILLLIIIFGGGATYLILRLMG